VPSGPIQVEIFPDHGGFAVRTLGEPGLGALGVCFGTVVAMDSPRARKAGHFNWGSTLWHEFAHVISLQMSEHNIPRWYSEGISVYEEHRARPGWGDDLTAPFVKAYADGRLLKVSQLNSGMMRPRFPDQIALSYYQAALVCELIEERFGFAKIPETLRLFAAGKSATEVFRAALGWDTARMDAEYAQYLDQKLKPLVAHLDFKRLENEAEKVKTSDADALRRLLDRHPDDFFANLGLGRLMRAARNNREAERFLKKAQELFPEFVEDGNPYQLLADIYLEEKREGEALEQLLSWTRYDEDAAAPLVRAAEIFRGRREWGRAAEVLERSVYVQPYDAAAQATLSECSMEAGRWESAVNSARAVVALRPTDPARAHYNLARALLGAGNRQEARREVLRALEIAPSFEEAQALLLKLRGGQS
jgi:tetratricopeptide (TPR) repeat protein